MTAPVSVELGKRRYEIVIGEGSLARAGRLIAPVLRAPRVIIVTDTNVAKLYLTPLQRALAGAGIAHETIKLSPGEKTKSFDKLAGLMDKLLAFNPDRDTALIALGGGVIGDITGFAASILLRGVDFIQIPTTLLAQVDSSVGGKTGINTRFGKNLVGAFHQPRLVIADIGTLLTLKRRELLAGYAEVAKYGIIRDVAFFTWLEQHATQALAGDATFLAHMVRESCAAKAAIVAADERESGLRALLNFGHTLGHALEAETGFSGALLHGEAVAIGMVLALWLSVRLKHCKHEEMERVKRHLSAMGLRVSPLQVRRNWDVKKLITHCYHDKKARGGRLTFVLAEKIGKTFVSQEVEREDLTALLAEALRVV